MTRYSKFIIVCSTLLFGFGHASFATTHHTPLEPASVSSVSSGWQEARIWFLPDWQRDTRSYNSNKNEDPGGGDVIGECGAYGYVQSCGLPKISTGTVKPRPGLTCQEGCVCPASYQYTASSCSSQCKNAGSSPCTQNGTTYYTSCGASKCGSNQTCSSGSCVCASGYKSCGGSCIPSSNCCTNSDCGTGGVCSSGTCGCATGYKACGSDCILSSKCCTNSDCGSNQSCSGGTCVTNHTHSYYCPSGYQASACSSSQVQTGTTSKVCSCGATSGTCYACRAKTCEEGGYLSAKPSDKKCTAISYAGKTCYGSCHYFMTAGKVKCIKIMGMNGPTLIRCCPTSKNGYYRGMGAISGGWETIDDIDVEVECEKKYGNDYCYEADYAVTNFDCGQL